MAIIKTEIRPKKEDGTYNDVLYPKTSADMVEGLPTSLPANGGNADTVDNRHFLWENPADVNPTFIWGNTNDNANQKLFKPSQLSVGNADTVDGVHAKDFMGSTYKGYNTYVNGVTDDSLLEWGNAQVELRVNHLQGTPMLAFHSEGATALGLFEAGCRLYTTGSDGRRAKRLLDIDDYNDLKSSVSSGKTAIANAITGKGVSASGSDTHATLANKITQIPTRIIPTVMNGSMNKDTANLPFFGYTVNTAPYSTVRNDFLFYISGDNEYVNITLNTSNPNVKYTLNNGYWYALTPNEDKQLAVSSSVGLKLLNPDKANITVTYRSGKGGIGRLLQ